MPDGTPVGSVTLSNSHGVTVEIITLGARIQSIRTPSRCGIDADIVLGYPTLRGYLEDRNYLGATVGRLANRLGGGRFTLLGKTYQVSTNAGTHSLHGGADGFDRKVWTIVATWHHRRAAGVRLRYVSADGEMGFPGRLTVTVTYTLKACGSLRIDLHATSNAPTVVNLTNHAYWNLAGEGTGSVMTHMLTVLADAVTPTDEVHIPLGTLEPVAHTPFDFRVPKPIGRDIDDTGANLGGQLATGHGYDINFVTRQSGAKSTRVVARASDPGSGRVLAVATNQPGLQFYSGNQLSGDTPGKCGHAYRRHDGFALEAQGYPDAPNHPDFPSATLLPGSVYHNVIIYKFSTDVA